jgi:cytochrome c553
MSGALNSPKAGAPRAPLMAAFLATLVPVVCMAAEPSTANRPAGPPPDSMEARAQGCATCHGTRGQGTHDDYFPRIAGKPQGYLLNQLRNFRDGRRSYPPMNYLLAYLRDDYFSDMAQFFSALQVPFAPAEISKRSREELAAGESLVKNGDPTHGVLACVACHGSALTGINPGIPGLIGLHSRYISAQLESWRIGTRRANLPDCMHDVAIRLTEGQITAVAAWLATQSPPQAPQPAPQGQWKTPLVCGSQPQ